MNNLEQEYIKAAEAIKKSTKVCVIAHRKPDGDSLGASLAVYFILKSFGKEITLACVDEPSSRFSFLPGIDKFQKKFAYAEHDLIVISDAGDSRMTNFHETIPEFLSNKVPIINIDHHISNDNYGIYNLVDPKASSSTVIIYRLAKILNIIFTKEIAICLLTGIYNDTGAFMHANTNLETFQIAAHLANLDVDISTLTKIMFRTKSIAKLRLWGLILDRLKKNEKNIASSVVTLEDICKCGAVSEDTGGIIDLIGTVPDAKFAMLLSEDEQGYVKGSFRTKRDDIDVAHVAAKFGGGGHKKASGFRIRGKLQQEIMWRVVPANKN